MRATVRVLRVRHPLLEAFETELTLLGSESGLITLSAPPSPELKSGERLIIEWPDSDQRARATVGALERQPQGEVTLELSLQISQPDARHYPRLVGGIALRFITLSATQRSPEALQAWLNHEPSALDHASHEAPLDELMNFSAYGLAFECERQLEIGAQLLCELGPKREQERWRTRAQVARSWLIQEGRSGVALEFEAPPPALIDALARFTLFIQSAST